MTDARTEELAARLAVRHEALRQMGYLHEKSKQEPAWWCAASEPPTNIRWMVGAAPYGEYECHRQHDARLEDGAEALALLNALSRVDFGAFLCQVECIMLPARSGVRETVSRRDRAAGPHWHIGFAYQIYARDDIAPVCEQIAGVTRPSESYRSDLVWIKSMFPSDVGVTRPPRTIPVQVLIRLASASASDLASVLRCLVASITAQHTQRLGGNMNVREAESARFEIVQVDLGERTIVPVNIEALECLGKLAHLGVRVPCLPAIQLEGAASQDQLQVVTALQALMLPVVASTSSAQVEYVHVNELISSRFLPALFSAVQASRSVKSAKLEVVYDPTYEMEGVEEAPDPEAAVTLWKWAVYALFSHHAYPKLENLVVDATHLDHNMIDAAEDIMEADNPLAALFGMEIGGGESIAEFEDEESASEVEDVEWILASRFRIRDPENDANANDSSLYVTQEPLRIRVVDSIVLADSNWWRVLLPGCGLAWVRGEDATESSDLDLATDDANSRVRLKFQEVYASNLVPILRLLKLLPPDMIVASIEIETGELEDDGFDMTDWMSEVLRLFPFLERIEFNCFAEIRHLLIFVEAAEAYHARLRSLCLNNTFNTDSTDVIQFLTVLSDMNHPMTSQLEEIDLTVYVDEATPFDVFNAAWCHMLKRNHQLHTITLMLFASHCVDDGSIYCRRCSPLAMISKIAFLSTVHPTNYASRARGQLDTGVLSTIFEFAAKPRNVNISFDER